MALQQVGILGLGVIGTSLGLALKRGTASPRIVGFDISPESIRRASRVGAIDRSIGTLAEACRESSVIVLAAPVRAILRLLPEIASHVQPDTLVTDTGGTKREIVRVAESVLPPHAPFVGGHPLTGLLTAGVHEPSATLFDGTVYCLTPSPKVAPWALETAVDFVQSLGAQPHWLDAEEHDGLLAAVSHLPYLASVALVSALASQGSWEEMGAIAAGGFRSVSALTDGDPQVWADVAATNRENIDRQLDTLIERLARLRELIASNDDRLVEALGAAQSAHRAWLARRGEAPAPSTATPAPMRTPRWVDRFRRG